MNKRHHLLGRLGSEIRLIERGRTASAPQLRSACGFDFQTGQMIEWLSQTNAEGAATWAMLLAAKLLLPHEQMIVVDPSSEIYPPAMANLGLDLDRVLILESLTGQEALWAVEQSLRCRGVAITFAWLSGMQSVEGRRLKLACEQGGGLGFLLRPLRFRDEPSWADQRWIVGASSRSLRRESASNPEPIPPYVSLRLEQVYCRGGFPVAPVDLEIDDETRDVRVLSPPAARAI